MANPNDNLYRLYQNGLKHFSLPDFDTFKQDMMDEQKRRRFYTNMQDAYSLPDFDTFSKDIGTVAQPPAAAPAQPAAQAQPQQQAVTPTVQPIKDNTAQQVSVQSATTPAQPAGWKPSPVQQQYIQWQMDQANARLKKMGEDFHQRMEGIEKGNRPGSFMGEREFNPQTGQMEKVFYTTQGERVPTQLQKIKADSDYHQWWENNTEAGKRSKEQRLQREFDDRLFHLWDRPDRYDAAEKAWSDAEAAYYSKVEKNRDAANFQITNFAMNSSDAVAFKQVEEIDNFTDRLTTHDLDNLMNKAWANLGEKGQQALIDDCYKMLRYRNPGADELVLYNQAKDFARQQSDLRLYNLAVEKNAPKSSLEYFMRKVKDMNLVSNIGKGVAVNRVKKTGDMAAYEAANEQYRQDGHKILDVAGMVAGFALDPTTWMSAGVGGAATRGTMWLGGRWLAGRGASAAVTQAATRQFATSMTGRIVGGIAGGAANFGTFEGVKEMENQFAHGGHIVGQDETGRYINEGYSAGAVAGQFGHGLMMGAAVGWLGPVSGNVSDKLVRATSSTVGKVATRAGVYTGATLAEGTIFSVPEWIEGERDAMDVWNDNMAMMVGFKAKHMLKSAGGVLGDLKASFDSPTNGQKNRLDFESRLRQRIDAPSDGGMGLTEDEKAELKRYGYDLRDLVESSERTGDPAEGSLIAQNAPEIVSRLTDMVTDPRVSEAARAKMYYYATGRRLPMSTVMRGELIEDGDGGFIVESQGANGVITSRSFKSRKAADLELERIKRQTELNSIEIGERYQQTADFENRLQEACRTVAAENGWDMVEVYRTCEEARRNHLRGGDKQFDEVQQNILRKVTDEMGEFEETGATDEIRGRINEKYGVDIDGAIRKEANRRTLQEQTAIDEYIAELIPDKAKEPNPVEDAQAEDITNQKLLSDEPAAPQGPGEGEPIDPRFYNSTPSEEFDPHQFNGELWPTGRAVMKFQDRPVEVLSGRVVMMDDGSMVDSERSDASIVIRDLATGKMEMVSPDAILSYEEYPETMSVEEVEASMQREGAEAPQPEVEPQSKYTSGQIKIRNSDGTETRGVLTGYVDENGNHEYYVEGDLQHLHYASEQELNNILSEYQPDEPQQPSAAQPQAAERVYPEGVTDTEAYDNGLEDGAASTSMSDEELNRNIERFNDESEVSMLTDYGRGWVEGLKQEQQRRVQAAQPEQPQQPEQVAPIEPTPAPTSTPATTPTSTPAEAPQGEVTMPTGVNPVGTIAVPQRDGSTRTFTVGKNAEGNNIVVDDRGFMWAHDGNGNAMQPYSPGANVPVWTDEQLSKLGAVQPSNEQTATVPNQPENVPTSTETHEIPTENAVSPAESVPNPAAPVENVQETPAPTAEPTPLQRIPRDAKGEPIFEQAENPEHGWDALVEFAEGDAATAKEIADTMAEEKRKAYEKAQKQKPKGKTPTEILASKKAISAGLAQAEQEYNLWQQMANVEQRRQDAIRAQQEAEARQRAAERAEAEKAEREAREEAARLEREALEGIPEWHLDTPENARKRGVRRFSGQMFTRQELVQGVVGHEVEVKFSQKDLPKGHVAVIEASQLQPSHIQGQRNPMFFIEEAQPKNRAEAVSMFAAKEMAEGIRPQEITGSATAYTGAPTINSRGEVIQGNNRSDALRYLWENKLPEQQQTYKQYLIDNAEQFGIDPEAVNAMQQPVLVNMLDVDDAEAIRLGQMTAQDTESGGVERIKPKNVAQKLGEDMRSFAAQLLRSGDEEASFGQLVDRNGTDVLKWMAQKGAITNKQGKTLDTYLVTFDRDFSKEELSALRAKAKALKGWYDRESKGWMLRSVDDAKAFAEDVAAKSEDDVADEAPLSMADMEKSAPKSSAPAQPTESPMKKVDVEGVFDALKTKGETKLSDHATPVEESPKPKKRRWISDEDADEFNSLRDNLRNHFGKGDDVVKESGVEYGQPKPKQMDAEVLRMGTRMTYLMMKGGLRSFSDYCEAMKDELPDIFDDMRPHLKSLYAAAQNMEEVMQLGWDEEMDDRKTVKAFDVYNFDKPGAKDIIATAQHTVDERTSQQQTDQIIQTLKDQRNEQRKKEADETSADTEAVVSKAEATADEIESKLEAANSEEDAEGLSRSIDKELEEVNKQLALLGYYEADPVDKDFNEAYGYMRNAERKAVQDAHRLATQLANDLGITIDPKDKVRKSKYGFGSKIARSNVAPAGGEVYITLPLTEGRELSIWLSLDKNEPWREGGREDRYDEDLMLTGIMYRVENTGKGGMNRYESSNHNTRPTIPYDELLSDIRRLVRSYLPEEQVKPATTLTPQPGEDMVDMAKRVAADKEPQSPSVEPQLPIGDLFGGLFDEQPQTIAPAKGKELDPATKKAADILKGVGLKPSKAKNDNLCKLLPQHEAMKQKHPDALLLFRSGNNYQVLSADAEEVANLLNLPLSKFTKDGAEISFTEFPHHALDKYLPQMVRAGKRVAVCEQIDEPVTKKELKPKSEVSTSNSKSNEKTDVQPRPEETGRRGQQPRPNEPLGEGAKHEDERTDGGRMAQRGGEHSVSDTGRGAGVSGQHQSERGVTAPRNTRNNHAERGIDYAPKGEKARIDANLAAIELAKKLLATGATATPQEMAILRRYSGWGGLGSAFNEGNAWSPNPINKRLREVLTPEEYQAAVMSRNSAYYTPAPVIDAMWDIAKALGFKGGNIMEGSAGIGNIIGLMPTDISERSNIHAVEIDNTTGGILSLLYPDAQVDVQGFEQTRIANGSVDLAITNVPFVTDLHVKDETGDGDLSKKFRDIHDFCIAKNVRKLREGGIGIFITSSGTLDKSQKLRNWLVGDKEGNADVVGVFRMNNQTFGGTAATSDIIVIRKRVNGRKSANAIDVSTVTPARTATFTDVRGKTKDLPLYVNRYFMEHPEHMGGEMFFGFEQGDTYRPTSIGLFPTRTADQAARMAAWVKQLADMDWSKEQGKAVAEQASQINEALGEGVKEGSMVTDSEGNLCVARMGRAVPLELNKNKIKGRTKEECFKDYTEIKSALAEVLKYQTEHDDDAGLQPHLDRLNRAYDTFVQRYGNLNKNNNLAWLRNDVDFSSIVALETYSEKGTKDGTKVKTYGKTDIFNRRVVEKESEPTPKNVMDGIIASLYKFGRIDTDYLATQLGKSQNDVKREIVESGLGYVDPTTGQMEVSYEYLSGNVREKLRQAREANEAAGGAYDANIKALEAVVPMNIPAHLIEFALGSSWIEPQLYERYIKERTELEVKLTNAGGTWHMSEPWNTDKPKNTEMGVRSESLGIFVPGHKLIEAALTNKTITVSRTVKDSDGGSHTETDPAATTACATKVDEIRQDFKDWAREQMQNDPALSMRMEEKYNEKFNNSVPKSIPDEFVPEHFGGAATTVGGKPFRLRPHQAKAVIRATTQPVLLAHEVGTGKTYTLITTAMEMRRLGTAQKPMIVVQNATVGQFVASAKALYPNAKILTLEDADRNAEGRKAFYAKIKFNDWDMIVVPQSVFERIPDSIERQTQFIQDKIEEKMLVLEQMKDADPNGRSMIVRAAEREISRLEDEMTQLANGGPAPTDKKKKDAKKAAITRQNAEVKARELLDRATDDVEDFDSMGIDAILVDEAHEYKHLGFATAMQRGVKGVDPSPSKKSQGVFLKAQAVLEKTGGKNVVFATGTPISNTAAEIWTFMRYLIPADVMKEYDIYYFDDFVRNFGNLQQMLEFKTNGKYDEVNRFAGYVNLPELVRIWSTVADTVLTREAGGVSDKIPQMEGGKAQDIFLPQTRALRSIMKFVKEELERYEKMTGKEKKENSHIPLVMYGIAKAAAVDARLVQSDAEDDPNSKTNEAVRQTLRTLEETKDYKGTIAIFADNYQNKHSGFNLYEDIRKKLIAAGVPEEQVVVMKSGMTVKKKLEIFDKVNAGEVRVVMGSTFTLGTGVNIQERLHTLIHLDAPNRPMDYTQRNGRILRQGNLHNTWGLPVRVLRFGVEDSLDVTAYQRLKTKGAIADSIMNGKQLMENSMENRSLEEDQDLFGDITAQLSGSEYAMLKNQIEKEVRKLRAAEKNWKADQTYIHNRKRQIAGQNKEAEQRKADNQSYLEKVEAATVGDITVGKLSFPSVDAMENFFTEQNKNKAAMQEEVRTSGYSSRPATSDITISVGGFDFKIHTEITKEMKHQQGDLFATAPAKMTYSCHELGIDAMPVKGNAIKNAVLDIMENVVSGKDFRERIENAERYIERNNAELESISKRDGIPFKDADALAKAEEKLEEYEELMKAEMAAKEAKYAEMDKDVEAASNIELTEEDSEPTASEPVSDYSAENANFASRYETQDGKTINYTSESNESYGGLFDYDFSGENRGSDAVGSRPGFDILQRERSATLAATYGDRLNRKAGEYCNVERVFTESGSFKFTSGEKIENADDVAFIFSALEDAAVEHTFAVFVKDGVPTVVELGMGSFNASIANSGPAYLAYKRINPDEVYFVHNHPSGNLKCSAPDVRLLKQFQDMCDVPVYGVIINLKTGKYGTFDTDNNMGVGNKRTPEQEYPLTLHKLDKQIFAPDYDPMTQPVVRGSHDVASFVNSHRMGDRAKMSFLVISQSGGIVGNIHMPYKQVSPANVEKMAQYISERVIQFGGMSAIVYGDFSGENNRKSLQVLRDRMKQLGGVNLLDVMRIEGKFTFSANDEGILYEPGSEYGASPEGDIRFREVEDDAVLKEFAEGKTVKAYRTMQVIDGKLYSPMATKVGGKATPEIKLGVPEQAEEHPEIIKRTKVGRDGVEVGYVVIDKGLGKGTLEVAFNPSIHASLTPLNDQFTSADIRPNLVIVETLIPKSELTSGYRAPMAKDAVGEMSWHSGTVSGKLAELGKPRRVILSRYDMPVRIVPFNEVAQMIAAQLEGTDIDIPYNVVTPQVRMELQHLGIAISDTPSGSVGENRDFGKAEYITDQEIERINAHQQEMAQTSSEAKSHHAEKLAKKFNTPIRIVNDPKELKSTNAERQARMRRSKGFYDPVTGEVVVVVPNNATVEDMAETVFHEVVAHRGLREMIGEENYDAFCDEVYNHLKDDLKKEVDEETTRRFVNEPGKGYEHHRRVAVDETFGRMSEKGFEDFTKAERGVWAKLKAKVLEAINKFLGSLKLPKWVKLGDNELRYMLWRSHERLRTKGDYVDMARDAAKREELGLSEEARFRDGETGDIWKDQSVGLEERITNAAIRLSNNQSGDLTLRNDTQRAVVNNLQSLLHSMRNRRGTARSFTGADRKVEGGVVSAMNAQAMFDRATVKRVSDLARILMQNGYLSGMTSGEMQRLLSVVKNATAMHDVSDSVQKIMDIMVNNQLRNAEGTLQQLLSIRGSKVDARGVEVQGMLDVEGQRTMEVVKKAMSLPEDDITDRIAEALNRMSDPDQTIADDAVFEYAGLHMALDYVQNIAGSKAEEKALREGLKTAKEERDAGRMTDDAYKQFVETTEDAIRKNKIERAEAYFNLVGRLSDSLRGSIENAKAFREAEKTRVNEIHHNANSDMEGRPTNEHHKDDWKDNFVNNDFVRVLFAPLGTFDQIMRVFGNKSANGEGYLWNRFMRGWVDCRNKELQGVKEKFAQLDEKAEELFGKGKTWGDIIRMEGKLPKATVSFWDGGEMRDHELTQGNLLYIYMVDKMTDGRMKLRRMGITEENIADIENFLDPRFKALGDWLQDEFLVATRNEYNETHKRMFGASMAAIENYFPLKILANARIDKEEDVNQQNVPEGITTKTGSIIKRRVNNLALDITGADALSVILDHIIQMEHWNAYAEWNRDLNTLRTYKRFRNQVINMTTVYGGGRRLWENFNDLCLMAAGEYRPHVSKLNKSAVNLAKGVTAAKVSFRMYTALKQFLSAPAYAPEVSMRAIAKSIVNPYGDFKWCLENMPIFRERWHSRISGDPRLLKSDMDWKMWRSRVMEISSRIGMTPNAFVDAVTVSIGARAMYETRLKQYLKEGYPADAAGKRAMQDATILFNQTQQSSESPFLSTMQVDKDWLSTLFTVFRNSSMSYTRQEFDAMRNLKRNLTPGQRAKSIEFMTKQILRDWDIDPETATDDERGKAEDAAKSRFRRQIKKDIMRVATFGFILQALWNLGPYLPYIFFGNNDDEKDKMWDDALTHAYFGSVEGLTGGDVMSSFGNMAASGEWNRNQLSKDMPLASDINSIANKFIGGKNAEAINDILNLVVQMGVGMNPQSITDAAVAITDACGDDPALSHEAAIFVMRVLQVPQSQLDKLYFDEIDMSGEEASKLTPEQLAQRFAEYKVKRGTPLAPWSWGDEERLGKYEELAKDRMKERLDGQGEASVIEAYADYEARYKAVKQKADEAKELIKTDYAAAAQAHAALQRGPDFVIYQRFGSLDKQLSRISKMWLTSKTPEEANLVASTITSYRAGMVKVLQAKTVEAQQSAMAELTTLMNGFYSKYQAMQPNPMQPNR